MLKYAQSLDPEKTEHFPMHLDVTAFCAALTTASELITKAWEAEAEAAKAPNDAG